MLYTGFSVSNFLDKFKKKATNKRLTPIVPNQSEIVMRLNLFHKNKPNVTNSEF